MKDVNTREELIRESGTVRFSDAAWAEARRRAEVIGEARPSALVVWCETLTRMTIY
jgi:hypothetical protein